jgi:hypothetical protein
LSNTPPMAVAHSGLCQTCIREFVGVQAVQGKIKKIE